MDVDNWTLLVAVELDSASAVRQARDVVRSNTARVVDRRVLTDVLTATGEIVKNALQHAWGPFVLTVRHDARSGRVRIGVFDGNPAVPQFSEGDPWTSHGHGLHVVNALAASWGATALGAGKDVWFKVDSAPDG